MNTVFLTAGIITGFVTIDKENCTITKDGKTYKLYGKVKIVDSFEDIKVKIVDSFEDADIKIVDAFEDSCGKVKIGFFIFRFIIDYDFSPAYDGFRQFFRNVGGFAQSIRF